MDKFLLHTQRVLFVIAGILMLLLAFTNVFRTDADFGLYFICTMFFIGGLGSVFVGFNSKK